MESLKNKYMMEFLSLRKVLLLRTKAGSTMPRGMLLRFYGMLSKNPSTRLQIWGNILASRAENCEQEAVQYCGQRMTGPILEGCQCAKLNHTNY